MNQTPFIHLFETTQNTYCYDVNTDQIIKLPSKVYEYLKNGGELTEEVERYLRALCEKGFLKSKKVIETNHPATEYLPYYYDSKLNFLILQVTQNCNLRCEYCVYSGKYKTRNHGVKRMTFEMAKEGLDFLHRHSRDSNRIIIGFYGGEPLLEINLIKQCVHYIERLFYGKNVVYSITTNATLLEEPIVEFLVEKNFDVIISLDGPQSVHDKSRRYAKTNKSSFATIIKNLEYIKLRYPRFYKENIGFNVVFTMKDGFDCVNNFFSAEELFEDTHISSGVVSDCFIKEERRIGKAELNYAVQTKYEEFKIMLYQLGELEEKYTSKILSKELHNIIRERFCRKEYNRKELPDKWHHGGPCIVGVNRLFLNADGDFYPCEKVCEGMEAVKIGSIKKGIDIKKAEKVLNIERLNEKNCHECWAYQYCNICAVRYGDTDDILAKKCNELRWYVENKLKDYCVLRELGGTEGKYDWKLIERYL